MARTAVPVTPVDRFDVLSATSPPPLAANTTDGNLAANDGYTILEMTLTGGVARDVVLEVPSGFDGDLLISDRTYPLPANGVYLTGVFPMSTYGAQILFTASGSGVSFRALSMRGAL